MFFFFNKPVGDIYIYYIYIYHYITPTSFDFWRCPEIGHPQDSKIIAGTIICFKPLDVWETLSTGLFFYQFSGWNIQHQVFSNWQGIFRGFHHKNGDLTGYKHGNIMGYTANNLWLWWYWGVRWQNPTMMGICWWYCGGITNNKWLVMIETT